MRGRRSSQSTQSCFLNLPRAILHKLTVVSPFCLHCTGRPPCNAYRHIPSTTLTSPRQKTVLIIIDEKTLKTHLVPFEILEAIFNTAIDIISLVYSTMLTVLVFIHHGLINALLVGCCSKTGPITRTKSMIPCTIIA